MSSPFLFVVFHSVGSYYVEGSLSGVEGQIHRIKNQNSIEDIPIIRLILHPELLANIALVKLERPPDVNSGFVRPACLPNVSSWAPVQRNREHPLLGQDCWTTGNYPVVAYMATTGSSKIGYF